MPLVLGVISDTHGLMRKEALSALNGTNLIVHAGDVGDKRVVRALEEIAPVVVVRGNVDSIGWAADLPDTAVTQLSDAKIYVLHRIQDLSFDPAAAGFNLVVYGHSHKALEEWRKGVLYLNPGSAGPRRFKLPISVAKVELSEPEWKISFVTLAG